MQQAALILTLSADAVFSARSATVGGHSGLDYIPGGALLGWAASRLYAGLGGDAFTVFHSGKVRFSDGLPLSQSGDVAFPVPQTLMERKRTKDGVDKQTLKLVEANLRVHPAPFEQAGGESSDQPEALKNMHVTSGFEVVKRRAGYRMKTAVENGRAAESELFGYENLEAGRRFAATIEADADVRPELLTKVLAEFDGKTLHLGRSRRAEYGGEVDCRVEPNMSAAVWPSLKDVGRGSSREVIVWVLSDLALDDGNGAPTLAPGPELLGLPPGRLIAKDCAISARRYAPFNGYLRRSDMERCVVAAGSVLKYELEAAPTANAFANVGPIGLYREAGLGRVWINPPMLMGKQPISSVRRLPEAQQPCDGAAVSSGYAANLLDWLTKQGKKTKLAVEIDDLPQKWFEEVEKFYDVSRRRGAAVLGPSSAQWGRVKSLCDLSSVSPQEFRRRLIDSQTKGDRAICVGDPWLVENYHDDRTVTLRQWMVDRLEERCWTNNHEALKQTLGKLAEKARALAKEPRL